MAFSSEKRKVRIVFGMHNLIDLIYGFNKYSGIFISFHENHVIITN